MRPRAEGCSGERGREEDGEGREMGVTALSARLRLSSSSSTSSDQSLTPDTSLTLPLLSSLLLSSDSPQVQLEVRDSPGCTSLLSSGSLDFWKRGGRLVFTGICAFIRPEGGFPRGSHNSSLLPDLS